MLIAPIPPYFVYNRFEQPLFCSGPETAQDLKEIIRLMEIPPHKLEEVMLQMIARTIVNKHSEGLVTLLEVYVNGFIAMSNDIRHSHLEKLSRSMLHGICAIFPPPKFTGHSGFDAVVEKKWVTVMESGTYTRRYWAGIWTSYNAPSDSHQRNAETYAP